MTASRRHIDSRSAKAAEEPFDGTGGRKAGVDLRMLLARVLVAAGIAVLSVVLGAHERTSPLLSPLDEAAHFDYATDLKAGHVPHWGTLYTQQTVRMVTCLNPSPIVTPVPTPAADRCIVMHRNPVYIAPDGYSYEVQQPPLAYIPYAILDRPNRPPLQALESTRRGGIVWTVIGAVCLLALATSRRLSLERSAALFAIALLSPVFVYSAATVTNDAAGIAEGALVCLVLLSDRASERRGLLAAGLLGVALGLTKGTFVFAPFSFLVATALYHLPRTWDRTKLRALLRASFASLVMTLAAVISYAAWAEYQKQTALVAPSKVLRALLGFSSTKIIRFDTVMTGLQQLLSLFEPYYPDAPLYVIWDMAIFAVIIGAVVLRQSRRGRSQSVALAGGLLVGLVVLAIWWPVLSFLEGGYNFAAVVRYGIPVIPMIAVIVVRLASRRGLLIIGGLLPFGAALAQLLVGKF